jgi:flagellar hook assembly protein FlgD
MKKNGWLLIFFWIIAITNYPNPFNPKGGEVATFECSAEASTNAVMYIYDAAARLMARKDWTLAAGGTSRTTWDGYSDFHERVGNGIYLYQVLDAARNRLGKGKIWVINR